MYHQTAYLVTKEDIDPQDVPAAFFSREDAEKELKKMESEDDKYFIITINVF
jgi:hypothetical protein